MVDDQRDSRDEPQTRSDHAREPKAPGEFALEIEHIPSREQDTSRVEDRQREPLEDSDRKRKPLIEDEERSTSGVQATDGQSKSKSAGESDRSFPATIENRFYVTADRNGRQHVYADSKGTTEIFQETDNKLQSKDANPRAVSLMMETVAHRDWNNIKVSGDPEFRREAWLEGQARGIRVEGYQPSDLDKQELAKREQKYLKNEIAPATNEKQQSLPDEPREPRGEPGAPVEQSRADRTTRDYQQGIEGVLVEQGSRPYKDNPKNNDSPYAVLDTDRGRETTWGAGIPDALEKGGAREGDRVQLRETGQERVTVRVSSEINGQTVYSDKEVNRRSWEATVMERSVESTIAQAQQQAEPSKDNGHTREENINRAEAGAERALVGAEKTLNTGAARDIAIEDGAFANENRAHEYMANGRNIAAKSPELKGAATMEAYIERQLKAKFPDDPMAVSRTMATARNKIGQMIARGQDFPQPRIEDSRQLEDGAKARGDQARETNETPTKQIGASTTREQKQEHDRSNDRER